MENQIVVTTFAPVFIPTLCRSEHFIKLLESLEKCTWSEYTEVYVSLDFPPSEKYVKGHQLIDEYLQKKEENNNFKELHVFRQNENLGVGGNIAFLRKCRMKYDRFIFSEDDNVFSPNFLVFANKGLEMFKNDPSVIAINGYTHPYNYKFGDNTYFMFNNDFSAWGYGSWNTKMEEIRKDVRSGGFRKSFSVKNFIKVKNRGLIHLQRYIELGLSRHPQNIRLYDTVLSLYMIIRDKTVICPRVSTVRNEGWDNTGNSSSYIEKKFNKEKQEEYSTLHINQQLDLNSDFDYKGNPMSFFVYNNMLAVNESSDKITWIDFFRSLISVFNAFIQNKVKFSK